MNSRKDLLISLGMLSIVVTFALIGLATDHNWPKMLRVSGAFITYASALLIQTRSTDGLPWRMFALAGACAGFVSGVIRPEFHLPVLIAGTVLAPLFLGTMHWLGLVRWRLLRRRIEV